MDTATTVPIDRPRAALRIGAAAVLVIALAGAAAPWYAKPSTLPWVVAIALAVASLLAVALIAASRVRRGYANPAPRSVPASEPVPPELPPDELRRQLETLRHTQAELLRAKQTAEAATMAKGEFLATMSHEIRTPLNGILPLLELVLSTPLGADQRDYLATAHESARELLRIVDAILDYSKLDAERLELETVGVNLRELVDGIAELMQPAAQAKGLRLSATIDANVRLAVRGDPVRLRQVLTNLVSNAIKFTERGGVQIHVSKRGETRERHEIMFAVRDSGIGIANDSVQRLFRPFTQADASTTRVFGGTGLGLAICKRLVDLMHGRIGVRSEPGRGSLFWFSVPLLKAIGDVDVRRDLAGIRGIALVGDEVLLRRLQAFASNLGIELTPAASPPDALTRLRASASMGEKWRPTLLVVDAAAVPQGVATMLRGTVKDAALAHVRIVVVGAVAGIDGEPGTSARVAELAGSFADETLRTALERLFGIEAPGAVARASADVPPALEPASPAQPLKGRVLLVEDNDVNRRVAERLLARHGLDVVAAANGREAVDALSRGRYDAVLMDCLMPVLDGFAATRAWREHETAHGGHVPILAMTANAMIGDRERCLASGMDDYITKPLDREKLAVMLAKWLAPDATRATKPSESAPPARPGAAVPRAEHERSDDAAPALDAAILADLLDTMGEEFGALVRVYLEDAPSRLDELATAASAHDAAAQVSPAHTLKSSSANIGATRLADIARRIEHAARGGFVASADEIEQNVRREYARVARELERLVARGAA